MPELDLETFDLSPPQADRLHRQALSAFAHHQQVASRWGRAARWYSRYFEPAGVAVAVCSYLVWAFVYVAHI